jgi:hypothetical protein
MSFLGWIIYYLALIVIAIGPMSVLIWRSERRSRERERERRNRHPEHYIPWRDLRQEYRRYGDENAR